MFFVYAVAFSMIAVAMCDQPPIHAECCSGPISYSISRLAFSAAARGFRCRVLGHVMAAPTVSV